MAGHSETYLRHIDENTGRIARCLEKIMKMAKDDMEDESEMEKRVLYSFVEYLGDYAFTDKNFEFTSKVKYAVQAFIDRDSTIIEHLDRSSEHPSTVIEGSLFPKEGDDDKDRT